MYLMQPSTQRAESVIARVKRPSNSEAAVLASLFPTRKRPSFDPNAECIVTPNQKKKKLATKKREKAASVRVVMLKNFTKALPKGKRRRVLSSQGRMKTVKLVRSMTALQVKNIILRAYEDLKLTTFVVLDTTESGHHLIKADDQDMNGESAIRRRGCLHLCEKFEVGRH